MDCVTCKHRNNCEVDPLSCTQYTVEPDTYLCTLITDTLLAKPGVRDVSATVAGSQLRVHLVVAKEMCDEVSKSLYTAIISRIMQRVLDDSDGKLRAECAGISFVTED